MALRTLCITIERPLNRESAGTLCDTTATRSWATLSAMERGTGWSWVSPWRLRLIAGTSSPASFRSRMVTRSTDITWKVMSATRRSSRSRSSSDDSFWATSSRRESFRAWRSAADAASTRSCPPAGRPGW